jgi:hypothetical protein
VKVKVMELEPEATEEDKNTYVAEAQSEDKKAVDDYRQALGDYMRPADSDDENESEDGEEREVVPRERFVEKKVHDYKRHEVEEVVPQKKDYCMK